MLDGFLFARLFGDWIFGLSALISIINPIGIAFIFAEKTRDLNSAERAGLAKAIARNSFFVLVASMFLGSPILAFFGISLEALRIAGGLVVTTTGWAMLVAEPPDPAKLAATDEPPVVDPSHVLRQGFFPLTMPLTVGPGSIATAIALAASRRPGGSGLLLSGISSVLIAATVSALIWLAYHHADSIVRRLGGEGTLVATKLSAFLLMCVGVQIVVTGVGDSLLRLWPAAH